MVFSLHGMAQDKPLDWFTDFEAARELSRTEDKPLLLYFTGSDWCRPCKNLKADFFNSEDFEERSKDFVLVLVDLPRNKNLITIEQRQKNMGLKVDYNKRGGFPSLVGMNADGEILGNIVGYRQSSGPGTHFAFLDEILVKY